MDATSGKVRNRVNCKQYMMEYLVDKPKRRCFTQDHISEHVKGLRELLQDVDNGIPHVHRRHEVFKANTRYLTEIEERRASEPTSECTTIFVGCKCQSVSADVLRLVSTPSHI